MSSNLVPTVRNPEHESVRPSLTRRGAGMARPAEWPPPMARPGRRPSPLLGTLGPRTACVC